MGITQIRLALGYNRPHLPFIIEQKQLLFSASEQLSPVLDHKASPGTNMICRNPTCSQNFSSAKWKFKTSV